MICITATPEASLSPQLTLSLHTISALINMKLKTSLLLTTLSVAKGQAIDLKRPLRSGHRKLAVTGLELIDSVTDAKVADLGDGTVVSIASLPNGVSNLNINAVSTSGPVTFDGPGGYTKTEGVAPYAYCGDSGGNYAACETNLLPTDTPITITATTGGASFTWTFTLSTSSTPTAPAPVAVPVPVPVPAPVPIAAPSPAGPCGVDEDTFRKWAWYMIEKVSYLEHEVVSYFSAHSNILLR